LKPRAVLCYGGGAGQSVREHGSFPFVGLVLSSAAKLSDRASAL